MKRPKFNRFLCLFISPPPFHFPFFVDRDPRQDFRCFHATTRSKIFGTKNLENIFLELLTQQTRVRLDISSPYFCSHHHYFCPIILAAAAMREITNFAAAAASGHQPPVVRKPNRVSVPEVATAAQGDPDSLKRRLAELNPSGTISVELPFQVPFSMSNKSHRFSTCFDNPSIYTYLVLRLVF